MLSDQEKLYLQDFLRFLDDDKLKNLSSAVTLGRMRCNSREEALSCILLHSESLLAVFNLRRVSPALLLKYLHHLNVPVHGGASKQEMIQHIFNVWKIPYSSAAPCDQRSTTQIRSITTFSKDAQGESTINVSNAVQPFEISSDLQPSLNNSAFNRLKKMIEMEKMVKEANAIAFDDFVVQFASVYYDLMNKPDLVTCHQHSLNSSHFFEKCEMLIKIVGDVEECEVTCDSCESVLKNLSELQKQHQLLFLPNLSPEGVTGKKTRDGLIHAAVCGTLHQRMGVVGQFKQAFVLSADPYAQHSCKIKESVLMLVSGKAIPSCAQQMLASSGEKDYHPALEGSHLQITDIS